MYVDNIVFHAHISVFYLRNFQESALTNIMYVSSEIEKEPLSLLLELIENY